MRVNNGRFEFTAFDLRVIALLSMFIDHFINSFGINNVVLDLIGRIAFPIFAFQLVEGYAHTSNYKKYLRRLFIFALISEIPFNIMVSGGLIYPFHQNVLWTMLIGLICIKIMDTCLNKINNKLAHFMIIVSVSIVGYFIGTICMVDYFGFGVLTCIVFYLSKRYHRFYYIIQFVGIFIINYKLYGLAYAINFFGVTLELPEQMFALVSLPLIWLYKGERGYHSKWWTRFYYWFYPGHIVLIYIVARLLSK